MSRSAFEGPVLVGAGWPMGWWIGCRDRLAGSVRALCSGPSARHASARAVSFGAVASLLVRPLLKGWCFALSLHAYKKTLVCL